MSQQQHAQGPEADAELKIYQLRIEELKGFKLPCDINFVNGKVGKGCSLYTLQLRILNHGEALRQATRIAEKQRDTLLAAYKQTSAIGRFCLSEDDCIVAGIDFSAYERGLSDAIEAFGNVFSAAIASVKEQS